MGDIPQLIGISGSFNSGKDTVARFLADKHGFYHASTGDMIRETAQAERGSIERPVLREVADAHRHRDGAGVFMNKALASGRPLVITGIRAMGEARALKAAGGVLLFVDAPVEVRYNRMQGRARDLETELTLEEFSSNEAKEWHSGEGEADFNLRDIKAMADIYVDNDVSPDKFVELIYQKLSAFGSGAS